MKKSFPSTSYNPISALGAGLALFGFAAVVALIVALVVAMLVAPVLALLGFWRTALTLDELQARGDWSDPVIQQLQALGEAGSGVADGEKLDELQVG